MTRLSRLGFLGVFAAAALLGGCPIFQDNGSGGSGGFCNDPSCQSTSSGGTTCSQPSDCLANQTCGKDGQCHDGDCTFSGCVSGYTCVVAADHTASCVPNSSSSSSGSSTSSSGAGGSGGAGGSSSSSGSSTSSSGTGGAGGSPAVVYCGNPSDCAMGQTCAPNGTCESGDCKAIGCIFGFACQPDGTCTSTNPASCAVDADCKNAGAGYACVSGICTSPDDQCFDQTQCAAADKCAAGKCEPACTTDMDCPSGSGYGCDTTKGICSKPLKTCKITNDCGGPSEVCVAGACVPRAVGGNCATGDWVENGCIPTQKATFICKADGQQDVCAAGSLCLHHACYISCAAPNQTACNNLPTFNVCKPVTTQSGAHDVCGSNQNLGGECDPTVANSCGAGKLCIDGFCK